MEKLARGEAEELARRLGIEDPRQWTYVRAAKLRDLPDVAIDRLVLHYDIMRPYIGAPVRTDGIAR